MVGDDAQALVAQIFFAGFTRGRSDQLFEQVDLVVAVLVLQNGGQPLQPHTGIHAGCGQGFERAVALHVELHEHVVPDLDIAVTVGVGRPRWATRNGGAVIVENFAAGTAGAGIGHHPEIVGGVFGALVVADTHHALRRQSDLFCPDVVGLVIVDVDRGPQFVRRQLVDLGQQFPRPRQRLPFEVIAKTPVAQHLEESVVPRGVTDVFQVVVFTAGTQAGLHRRRAHIGAFVGAQKHVLELHHARIDKHQRRVVAWHQWAGGDDGVSLGREKVQERFANIGDGGVGGWGWSVHEIQIKG